jgi:DNA-binding response OmpR family regulator
MKKVLIVDDDNSVRMTFKVLLRKAGYGFIEAENGEQGLQAAASTLPDLILCDINLGGGLNGFKVVEGLRANATTASIPIILITGDPVNHTARLKELNVDFLEKPFSMNDFLSSVRRHLPPETD